MRLLLIALAWPLLAASNAVTIHEAAGVSQSAQPRTILHAFRQGEFPAGTYPKPRLGGATPAAWQVDVSTVWPDGSVQLAHVSTAVTVAAGGSVVMDFVRDANPCHLGNLATCQAAALDQSGMLAFNGGAWGGTIEGTAGGLTYGASARTMITAGAWSYRLRGPVVTQVVAEDVTRPEPAFDFGWQWDGTAWGAPANANYKSAHPIFVVSFHTGWAGVEIEAILENCWTTRLQRLVLDIAVKSGAGGETAVYAKTAFDLARASGFTRYFWSGAAPAAVQVDHNLRHLIGTGLVPAFDYGKSVPSALMGTLLAAYTSGLGGEDPQSCAGATCASWERNMPETGGRGDIALIPQWYSAALLTMGDTANYSVAQRLEYFEKLVVGNADAMQTVPFHYKESDNSAARDSTADGQRYYFNYDSDTTTPAFGRIYSIQARPTGVITIKEALDPVTADRLYAVCSVDPCEGDGNRTSTYNKGWVFDQGHVPSGFFVPYLLTGRYSYLLAQQEMASLMPARFPAASSGDSGWRDGKSGFIYVFQNEREIAWSLREIFLAALISPSGTPEKVYFTDLLKRNDLMWEGIVSATGGNAQASGGAIDCRPAASVASSQTQSSGTYYTYNAAGSLYRPNGVARWIPVGDLNTVTSVTVNGAAKTFGVYGVDSGRDWYYVPGGLMLMQDAAGTPLTLSDTLVVGLTHGNGIPLNAWCRGRHIIMKGVPNPLGTFIWSSVGELTAKSTATNSTHKAFMRDYIALTLRWIETSGALLSPVTGKPYFYYVNRKIARNYIGRVLHPDSNLFFADQYSQVGQMKTNGPPQTFAELMSGDRTSTTLDADMTAGALTFVVPEISGAVNAIQFLNGGSVKIDNEWMQVCAVATNTPSSGKSTVTVCSGTRGWLGTVAAVHAAGTTVNWTRESWYGNGVGHSYPNLFVDALAAMEDLSAPEGSGRAAWEKAVQTLTMQDTRSDGPEWMFVPRERIANVRAMPGVGALGLRWVAPSGEACRVYVGEAETSTSDDSGDGVATVVSREQGYVATGLSAGAAHYRISCGSARHHGTATVQ